jgi:hypothetical protein
MWHRVCLLLALAACSSRTGLPTRQADGAYELSCRGALTGCLDQAERLCREQGYRVAAASDARELLGHEHGQSQVEVRRSRATIYCGSSDRPARPAPSVAPAPPPRATPPSAVTPSAPPAAVASAPAAAPASAPARACVPGSTQACVGPGGCSGGQACSDDGSRFELCDCGSR